MECTKIDYLRKSLISSIKFDRKFVSVDLPSIKMPFWGFCEMNRECILMRKGYEHTVDLNKRAIGCPRIVSEYKDAAELIWSTTKIHQNLIVFRRY